MSDPSMNSSNTGPHFPGQGPKPHPEFTQHVHHHSLFHPRAQMPGLGPAGPAATTFQPGCGHGYGHWHGAQHYRRFRGPSRLIWFALGAGATAFFYSRSQHHAQSSGYSYRQNWACRNAASPTPPVSHAQPVSSDAPPVIPASSPIARRETGAGKTESGAGDRERAIVNEFGPASSNSNNQTSRAQNLERITAALEGLEDRHLEKMSKWIKRFQ
ncbi:hypothetical protein HD553DRAFT_49921 [Filobasidium floriforme]|uniref:uncharacterized protein n=1 Tax=Filobasidium floriforme TaxID=5210 RepID=UPI001E8E4755|nr:uncharacterized protein HD553DRAFT_49921 [Filobasidium floriforme]KAH8083654.1 hypothetical protein HD553DRAFT_49921 [Filobasidium floriforme]